MILAAPPIAFILVPSIALALLRYVCSGCRLIAPPSVSFI
jgi:hypothetical protein